MQNTIKIVICSNILWTITQFRLGLIKSFIKVGYQVVCIADVDDFSILSEKKIIEIGAKFILLPTNRKGINPFKDVLYFFRLCKILKDEKPDIVINYTIKPVIYGSIAANIFKIPSLAISTGLGFVFIKNNMLTKFVRQLYKFSLQFPKRVFFLNNEDLEIFIHHNIIEKSKASVLPGEGINTSHYYPEKDLKPKETFTFLLIARLLWEKGIGEYVEAAKFIKKNTNLKVEFKLLGYIDQDNPGGIKVEKILEWVNEGFISYLGNVEDVKPIISNADCIVLPSYYREGIPRTLLEAAAMAKPIITTNSVGCKEVVDDKITGLLCEAKNAKDLYNKMLIMVSLTPEERQKMGYTGRKKVIAEFDENIVINRYFEELRSIMSDSGVLREVKCPL